MDRQLPPILSSYSAFRQHIESQTSGLYGHEKGDPWQEFSKKIIPLTDFGKRFTFLKDNIRKTRDGGWDIIGHTSDSDEVLYIQARYQVADINKLEEVVSSWVPLAGIPENQLPLEGIVSDQPNIYFALVTMSDLQSAIVPKYKESRKPGATYFNRWHKDGRVSLLDGPRVWLVVKDTYLKAFSEPRSHVLSFERPFIHFGDVYLGVIRASEIRRIYKETGDSIFF